MKFYHSKPFRLVVSLISLILVFSLSRSIYSLWRKKDVVKEKEKALIELEIQNKKLAKEFESVQSEGYIEQQARNKLGLVKEGETVVLLPRTREPEPNDQKNTSGNIPNWKRWWELFN